MWRPWEEKDEEEVVNLSAAVQKRKRRSPAAAARSRQRLQQWKEKKNRSRLEREQDMGRLISELRTTPLRKVEQIRSANLLQRLDECINCNKRKGSKVEALEEEEVESSVLFSNHFQTIMLPQLSPSLTNTKNTLQSTSSLAYRLPASL